MNWRRYLVLIPVVGSAAAGLTIESAPRPTRSDNVARELSLELNIPAFRLDVFQGEGHIRAYVIAVGSPRYRTPSGDFLVRQVTWNPWWYPPPQPWARHEKITRPGESNPMGKVKLHLGGGFYLHGTPSVSSIGSAASHGCVRMRGDDAVALAKLVQSTTGATIANASVDSLIASWSKTRTVDLPRPVAVRFVYELAEVRNDSLLLHPDIYRLRQGSAEAGALQALAQYTPDTNRVDRAALRQLVRRARSEHVSSPVARLFPNGSPPFKRVVKGRPLPLREGGVRTSSVAIANCGR
jgi:hypothetical protein